MRPSIRDAGRAGVPAGEAPRTGDGAPPPRDGDPPRDPEPRPRAARRGAPPARSPEAPPLSRSLVEGLRAVVSSPPLLLTALLAVLLWGAAYSAFLAIFPVSPSGLVLLTSLPPIHSFLDLQYMTAGGPDSALAAIGFGAAVLLVRAALLAVWIGLLRESLLGGGGSVRTSLGGAADALRAVSAVAGLEGAFLALAIVIRFAGALLGPQVGQVAAIGGLGAGLHFLVLAPVAAVTEGTGLRESARLSATAARLPRSGHVLLAFSYLAATLLLSMLVPATPVTPATPSAFAWAYVLAVALTHLAVLGAFTYRWLAVREAVREAVVAAAAQASGPSRR